LHGHPGHCGDSLIPRISVGITLDVSGVSIGLAILIPGASCPGVGALHIRRVTVSLDVVRVPRCVIAGPKSTCSIAICLGQTCEEDDGNGKEYTFHDYS
jgi:hypothetical protein